MSARTVRAVAMVVFFLVGIPGMIISSINEATGAAVTFGLIAAGAAMILLAVTAVATGRIPPEAVARPSGSTGSIPEAEAEDLERRVTALVASGAPEDEVRDLVRAALRLSRSSR